MAVVVTYFDFFLGMPSRFLSNKAIEKLSWEDDSEAKKPTVIAFTVTKAFGDAIGVVRQFVDFADVFVSKYLAITTAAYVTFKFLHFRVFN